MSLLQTKQIKALFFSSFPFEISVQEFYWMHLYPVIFFNHGNTCMGFLINLPIEKIGERGVVVLGIMYCCFDENMTMCFLSTGDSQLMTLKVLKFPLIIDIGWRSKRAILNLRWEGFPFLSDIFILSVGVIKLLPYHYSICCIMIKYIFLFFFLP